MQTLLVGLLVVGSAGSFADARIAHNETSAVASMVVMLAGQATFHKTDFYRIRQLKYANPEDGAGFSDLYQIGYPYQKNGQKVQLINVSLADARTPDKAKDGYYFADMFCEDYSIEFGVCAVPADYPRSGKHTFIMDTGGTVYMRDNGGKPIRRYPKDLAGWRPVGSDGGGRRRGGTPVAQLVAMLDEFADKAPEAAVYIGMLAPKMQNPQELASVDKGQLSKAAAKLREMVAAAREIREFIDANRGALQRAGIDTNLKSVPKDEDMAQVEQMAVAFEGFASAGGGGGLLDALGNAREKARRTKCMSNLKMIGVACHIYSTDKRDRFPVKLQSLYPKYIQDEVIYQCPTKKGQLDYGYITGLTAANSPTWVLAYDKKGNHTDGRNVLFLDGHVEWLSEAEFRKRLSKTLMGARRRGQDVSQLE